MKRFKQESKCRVLVVDDDFPQMSLFTEVLEQEFIDVLGVLSSTEALEILHTASGVDLLVADIQLAGGTNGYELAAQAKRLQPDIKVMFITGHSHETALKQRAADPSADVMCKPFKLSEFAQRVSDILEDLPCHKTWLTLAHARGWA